MSNTEHNEAAAIAVDLAYQRLKDSGELHRMECERALAEQVKWEAA